MVGEPRDLDRAHCPLGRMVPSLVCVGAWWERSGVGGAAGALEGGAGRPELVHWGCLRSLALGVCVQPNRLLLCSSLV